MTDRINGIMLESPEDKTIAVVRAELQSLRDFMTTHIPVLISAAIMAQRLECMRESVKKPSVPPVKRSSFIADMNPRVRDSIGGAIVAASTFAITYFSTK